VLDTRLTVKVLEFSGGEREDLPYRKYCMGCRGMFRDTTRSVSREWPEKIFSLGMRVAVKASASLWWDDRLDAWRWGSFVVG